MFQKDGDRSWVAVMASTQWSLTGTQLMQETNKQMQPTNKQIQQTNLQM